MKTILTSKGQETLVDDEDYPLLSRIDWCMDGRGYVTSLGVGRFKMHRLVVGYDGTRFQVDHIDGNRLNNQKSNLRLVSNKTNQENLHKKKGKNPASEYIGVTFDKRTDLLTKRWIAMIKDNYKSRFLGRFLTENEAAEAYNRAAEKLGYLTRNVIK